MRYQVVQDALASIPFVPFAMKLTSGIRFEVRHPEFLSVTKDAVYLFPVDNEFVHVLDMLHVELLEFLGDRPKGLPPSYRPPTRSSDDFLGDGT